MWRSHFAEASRDRSCVTDLVLKGYFKAADRAKGFKPKDYSRN